MLDPSEIKEKVRVDASESHPEIIQPKITHADKISEPAQCLSVINNALALNKLNEQRLQSLQKLLVSRLHQCRTKLIEIQHSVPKQNQGCAFNFLNCGMPYFKDKNFMTPPDNEDTLSMKNLQMFDFSLVPTIIGWTVKDKASLASTMFQTCLNLKRTELKNKIKELKINQAAVVKSENPSSIYSQVQALQAELNNIRKTEIRNIMKPIDYDYDWDLIAKQSQFRHSPLAYRGLWKLFLHPSISKQSWTKSEHLQLKKLANDHKLQDWDTIAKELKSNRTGYQCFVYFRTNIKNRLYSSKWSDDEIEHLKSLVEQWREGNYIPWAKVAASLKNRTRLQVYQKYVRLLGKSKGRFSAEEDAVLLTCLKKFGHDYNKIKEYLPGRSVCQLRTRSKLISAERRVSTVWTVEEDKKLIKLTANQDSKMDFSSLTKYFPGKDRSHLRSRFITLSNWIKKNPNTNIILAPRRVSRILRNVAVFDDVTSAVKELENPSPELSEARVTKHSKLGYKSSEEAIDRAITVLLHNRHNTELYIEAKCQENSPTQHCSMKNLHNLLILLKSSLKREVFVKSSQCSKYSVLLELQKRTLKTFSKKNPNTAPDIWGYKTFTTDYVLPPHYDTMIGCRKLMSYSNCDWEGLPRRHALKFLENKYIREQFYLLLHRLNILFLWPMLLSNTAPEI